MVTEGAERRAHTELDCISGIKRFHGFLNESWVNGEYFRNVYWQPSSCDVGVLCCGNRISEEVFKPVADGSDEYPYRDIRSQMTFSTLFGALVCIDSSLMMFSASSTEM